MAIYDPWQATLSTQRVCLPRQCRPPLIRQPPPSQEQLTDLRHLLDPVEVQPHPDKEQLHTDKEQLYPDEVQLDPDKGQERQRRH